MLLFYATKLFSFPFLLLSLFLYKVLMVESHCICYVVTRNTVCSLVRGDNPQALASGLSPIHVDNHGITILPPTSV